MVSSRYIQLLCTSLILMLKICYIKTADDCIPVDQCTCKLKNGKYISLWDIDKNGDGYEADDALSRGFTYKYSPCTPLKNAIAHSDNVLISQNVNSDNFVIGFKPKAVSIGFDGLMKQYQFKYTGSSVKATSARTTTINLNCDTNNKVPEVSSVLEQPAETYSFTLTTKCACPGACRYSPTTSSSSGLSTGSILCILLLVLVIVYLVGGILFNKFVRHQESSDLVPNKTFWKDFPFLVKDGCGFTYKTMRGKRGDYKTVEGN